MKVLRTSSSDFADAFSLLTDRTAFPADVEQSVREMMESVRTKGDLAVTEYAKQFDGVDLVPDEFRLSQEEIAEAKASLTSDQRAALVLAHEQIQEFAAARVPKDWRSQPREGVVLGERYVPLARVAAYVPGGAAPLVSTVLHTVSMATVAGVKDIAVLSPPTHNGTINPAVVAAADLAGATEILRLGGVYGIAAAAFGTDTIRRADKIVGPGNAYVTAAKRLAYGHCALDLVAGPSEVLIIADETADPRFVAADMLAQAEHGSGLEQAVLVATHAPLIEAVAQELEKQATERLRTDCIRQVLQNGIFLIEARDLDEAISVADDYAAEHLEVMTADPEYVAARLTAAGAIFLGPWTPEPVGDFVAGPSHVLPTGGAARYFSGLTVEQFCRRMSIIKYDEAALRREMPAICQFAEMEQLDAHGRSVTIRFDQ